MTKTMNKKHYIFLAIVLAVIGFKVFSSSPSSTTSASGGDYQLTLATTPNPPTGGKNVLTVSVVDSAGKAVDGAAVIMDINMTTMNMGSQSGTATPQGNGAYALNASFSMLGPWKIATTVTLPDGQTLNKDFTVNIR